MNDAQSRPHSREELIVVPDGEVVMRRLADFRPGASGCGRAGYECVLIGIASGDIPVPGDSSTQSDFIPVGSLAPGFHDPGWIVGIGGPGIRTVQPKYRGR